MAATAAKGFDPRALRWVAFTAGRAGHRRLWAVFVLPDPADPDCTARAVTVYLEQGWGVLRVTAHPTPLCERPGDVLARLVARRPPGYRSALLPIELHPGHPGALTRLARIMAVRETGGVSIALGD